MLDNSLKKYQLFLASKSPRRSSLLKNLGVDFEVCSSDANEDYTPEYPTEKVAEFLARKKANTLDLSLFPENVLIISADTVVKLENTLLGKPKDKNEAKAMLRALSGREHEVISGVCLTSKEKQISFSAHTNVWFKKLTDGEIDYYIENYKPFDKAGSYGIQEWIGYIGIERISGSYFNVMGLPVHKLYEALLNF